MQEHLQEIEGTLARTAQRKQTIISNLHKRQREQEILHKFGIIHLPSNPSETDNLELIKYKVNLLKQKIGEQIANIRNPSKFSIAKDGEAVIRSRNDEINRLLLEKYRWEIRLFNLSSNKRAKEPQYPKKAFFGCAKELPEAVENDELEESESNINVHDEDLVESTMSKNDNYIEQNIESNQLSDFETDDYVNDDSSSEFNNQESEFISNNTEVQRTNFYNATYKKCIDELCSDTYRLSLNEKRLMHIEQNREKELRRVNLSNTKLTGSLVSKTIAQLMSIEHNLPSEDDFRRQLIEDRKQRLLNKFDKLRNSNK